MSRVDKFIRGLYMFFLLIISTMIIQKNNFNILQVCSVCMNAFIMIFFDIICIKKDVKIQYKYIRYIVSLIMILIIFLLTSYVNGAKFLLFTESIYYLYQVVVPIGKLNNKESRLSNIYYDSIYYLLLAINLICILIGNKSIYGIIIFVMHIICLLIYEIEYRRTSKIQGKVFFVSYVLLGIWEILAEWEIIQREPLIISLVVLESAYLALRCLVYKNKDK